MIFWFFMACFETAPEKIPVVDADEDGFLSDVDCDDQNVKINAEAIEICNGVDDDCDGLIDEEDDSLDRSTAQPFFLDTDGDGFGAEEILACNIRFDLTDNGDDCDDSEPDINPSMEEVCNMVDDNCDDVIDSDAIDQTEWFRDLDGDGFGDINQKLSACTTPDGFVADATDCDDVVFAVHPQAIEICNVRDDDCDGLVDDLDPDVDWTTGTVFYLDTDNDGFGVLSEPLQRCAIPEGYATESTDCNDEDIRIHPQAVEVCDDIDNDCDALSTEGGLISAIIAGGERSNITMNQIYTSAQSQEIFFCTGSHSVSIQSSADLELTGIGAVSLQPLLGSVLSQNGGNLRIENVEIEGSLSFQESTVTLNEMELSLGGNTGLLIEGGSVSGNDIEITDSEGEYGGAIHIVDGSLSLSNSVLQGNTAEYGGAIYADQSTISIVDSQIYENTGSAVGGVFLNDSSLSCTGQLGSSKGIFDNTGYGIQLDADSDFVAIDCDIVGNTPEDIATEAHAYFAGEDKNFSCAQGICGSSVAYSVSGLLVDDYSNNNAFRGNIYDVVGYPTLDSFDIALEFSSCDVDLVLYGREEATQPWTLLYEESMSLVGGSGWITSGPVGLPLLDGEQILVGGGWVCDSAPDYSSYTPTVGGYGIGIWSGFRVVDTNYSGSIISEDFGELTSNYLYQQRLYVTSLY